MSSNEIGVEKRWELGIPHDKRSIHLYNFLETEDYKQGDVFGDEDNGEYLMYLLDMYFARMDQSN